MSENSQNDINDQEIDLSVLIKKIGLFFNRLKRLFFNIIVFFIKNIWVTLILLFLGFGIGTYLDKSFKEYDNQIIVQPNFGSTDYLFSQINLISSKIREKDTVFFKAIGIKNIKTIKAIEINPILDVNRFVNTNSDQNFELLKLMTENGDIKKILEDKVINRGYEFYLINLTTTKVVNKEEIINPILKFLNESEYYKKIQKANIDNIKFKSNANSLIIEQIDGFVNSFSNNSNVTNKSDKLVYYNENTQLNDVIETKNKLVQEQGYLRLELVNNDKIIKDNSTILNIENNKSINGKLKLILPILFIFIFIVIVNFISFYKKQLLLNQTS